jgi:hypothetical protein
VKDRHLDCLAAVAVYLDPSVVPAVVDSRGFSSRHFVPYCQTPLSLAHVPSFALGDISCRTCIGDTKPGKL